MRRSEEKEEVEEEEEITITKGSNPLHHGRRNRKRDQGRRGERRGEGDPHKIASFSIPYR